MAFLSGFLPRSKRGNSAHYDHALDAPEVARVTGAQLVGSESTANIARGAGLPEAQIAVVRPAGPLDFGAFRVTFLPSAHAAPNLAPGRISTPLRTPARASAFKDGGSFSILVEHPSGNLLIQSSAGFVPGALEGRAAAVALLSVADLGRRSPAFRRAYFDQVAGAVGARLVYPIHHDDFTHPLDAALRYLPAWMDDTPTALRSLRDWAAQHAVRVAEFLPWQPTLLLLAREIFSP